MKRQRVNLTGMVFGLITVKKYLGGHKWKCVCVCGKQTEVFTYNLTSYRTTSCGSRDHTRTHGMYQSREYRSWSCMVQRCHNPKNPRYKDWGGRGIRVCVQWRQFKNFLKDMGLRPPGTTIERKDNDKGYNPDNCKWADSKEQSLNKRSS